MIENEEILLGFEGETIAGVLSLEAATPIFGIQYTGVKTGEKYVPEQDNQIMSSRVPVRWIQKSETQRYFSPDLDRS